MDNCARAVIVSDECECGGRARDQWLPSVTLCRLFIAFAEQKTSPVTESSATAAREPPHRRAAPQDFTRLGTNAMSGPGVYEPGEEYVPAGIKPLVDEGSLPVAPAADGEELWLIQIPHDADPADLDGLRFKISDEDAGPEISQFKAGGKF